MQLLSLAGSMPMSMTYKAPDRKGVGEISRSIPVRMYWLRGILCQHMRRHAQCAGTQAGVALTTNASLD